MYYYFYSGLPVEPGRGTGSHDVTAHSSANTFLLAVSEYNIIDNLDTLTPPRPHNIAPDHSTLYITIRQLYKKLLRHRRVYAIMNNNFSMIVVLYCYAQYKSTT